MREILFRGKRLDNGEWVEGFYSPVKLPIFGEMGHFINEGGYKAVEIDPSTVGQFTGLLDKNGKRIFEGDILSLRTSRVHEVKFADGGFYMEGTAIPIKHAGKFRIIGNIHDNPELMEVNEDG